ncbi:MAG: hypothetical protein ACLR0U_02685 [Enterocloster clostridioformis]
MRQAPSGKTYSNRWANLFMKFPEAAELMLGDGSYYSYPLRPARICTTGTTAEPAICSP